MSTPTVREVMGASVKDLIDLLSVIDSRTEEIKRAEANLATQRSKMRDAVVKLAELVNIKPDGGSVLTDFTYREIITAAQARVGRFYLYQFNKETKESALAKDR